MLLTPTPATCPTNKLRPLKSLKIELTGVLVLGGLQVVEHLLGQLRQEAAMDQVVLR